MHRYNEKELTTWPSGSRTWTRTLNYHWYQTHHWTWSWASFIHLSTPQTILLRSILMLSSNFLVSVPSSHFLTTAPTKILYTCHCHWATCPEQHSLLDFPNLTILEDLCIYHKIPHYVTSWRAHSFPSSLVHIFTWALYFQTLIIYILPISKRYFITTKNSCLHTHSMHLMLQGADRIRVFEGGNLNVRARKLCCSSIQTTEWLVQVLLPSSSTGIWSTPGNPYLLNLSIAISASGFKE